MVQSVELTQKDKCDHKLLAEVVKFPFNIRNPSRQQYLRLLRSVYSELGAIITDSEAISPLPSVLLLCAIRLRTPKLLMNFLLACFAIRHTITDPEVIGLTNVKGLNSSPFMHCMCI